jgi:hypothetical protein
MREAGKFHMEQSAVGKVEAKSQQGSGWDEGFHVKHRNRKYFGFLRRPL